MIIERELSGNIVNKIVNDPSVFPWICGPIEGPIDLSPLIESGQYIALIGEYGGFLFWHVQDGIYDAHSAVLPEGRGKWALQAARDALVWMFEKGGAQEIMMVAPKGNLAVLSLIRVVKAKFRGKIEDGWLLNGSPVPCGVYSLTKMDWEQCLL